LGKPVFSPASIKARLDALTLVGVYANRLYALANTTAPSKFQSAATALGSNLSSLDKSFEKLQNTSDPTANKYVGPISSLVGTIGEMFLERKRDELIRKAVTDGAPQVEIILSQVRDDMDKIFSLEIVTGSNERLATLISAYNNADRAKLTYEQRMARLNEIEAAFNEVKASTGSAPAALVTSMMEAHKALVQEAAAPTKSKMNNLSALNGALQQWTTQIETLSTQIKPLMH
jgi:iron-sulfur cluster repair protein YtfE (RIC family)